MADIELRGVSMRFGEVGALADLSLTVRDGEFVTLLGPSGCGKSTTLNLVAGLLEPSGGDILIGGRRVNDLAPKDRKVAMVFQDYALYPHMTVAENLAFPLKAARLAAPDIRRKVHEVAGALGIVALLERVPKELSGGQRQRVALGRALVRDPSVFLMDEPLSNLDARLRVTMRAELKRLHRQLKATVIYVTHDQAEAMTLSDRIAILRGGVLQQVGAPREIYRAPANQFVASFMGSVGMNFLVCQVEWHGDRGELVGPGFRLPLARRATAALAKAPRRLTVGIRPEHVRLHQDGRGFPAAIEVVEYLGSEVLVHLILDGGSLIARAPDDESFTADDRLSWECDWASASVFDAETEQRIVVDLEADPGVA